MTAIDKLRQDAAGLLPQGERSIYNRTQLEEILAEVDALVRERDAARREVCAHLSSESALLAIRRTPEEIAASRGWLCFPTDNPPA